MTKYFIFIFAALMLTSCASYKSEQEKLKGLIEKNKYEEAIEFVSGPKFFPEERSRLLKLLELGGLHYLNNNYKSAVEYFNKAQALSDELYTKSISKMASGVLFSDNLDNYYGEKFERSLLRFYQALSHYELARNSEDNNERRSYLQKARANILDWDSLLSNYKDESLGENIYKMDLTLKIFGAFIHEQIGTRTELGIAKNLYRDAKEVLLKYYNLYPSFNLKSEKFNSDFEKLHKLTLLKLKADYIEESEYAQDLLKFIDQRLKDLDSGNKDNLKVLLNRDFVARKVPKEIKAPIPTSNLTINMSADVSTAHAVTDNVMDIFSFTFFVMGVSSVATPLIDFELPSVEEKKFSGQYKVKIYSPDQKLIHEESMILIEPLSEIAHHTLEEKITRTNARIGARIALKYVAAIVSSYAIYRQQPNFLGQTAALLSYTAAAKAIAMSERADLRFWSTLPDSVMFTSLKLDPGNYEVVIEEIYNDEVRSFPQGPIEVTSQGINFLNIRI